MTRRFFFCWLCVAFAGAAASAAPGIKEGKDATVLVDLGEEGSGSGFCLDAKGLFVTNRHVIASVAAGGKVKVVFHPAEPDQRVIEAAVVARSEKFDLAVLKAAEPGELTAVRLGDDAAVTETDTITAFGYPFGKMLAANQTEYPSCSVNTGKVTALRRQGKTLSRLQIDATVNPGNSGGPVLNADGQVIGIVVSGFQFNGQTGVNFAIPVSQLREFLKPAYVELIQPSIQYSGRHEETEFAASVFQYGKTDSDLAAELTLDSPGTPARKIPLKRKSEGTFTGSAVPVPDANDAALLPITALTADGLQRGWVKDHEITIAGQTVKLSELKWLSSLPDPKAVFADGHEVPGAFAKLGQATIASEGSPVILDLSSAVSIRFDDPTPPDAVVRYTLTAEASGKSVGESSGSFQLLNVPGNTDDAAAKAAKLNDRPESSDEEPDNSSKPQTLLFGNDIDQAFPAAAGRMEIIHLHSLRTYAVIDLLAGKVTSWIRVDSPDACATAGLNDLFVTTADRHALMHFDLHTGKLIDNFNPSRAVAFSALMMGDASTGPLVASVGRESMLLQLPSYREIPANWRMGVMGWSILHVSGDGHTLCGWDPNQYPYTLRIHINNDRVTGHREVFGEGPMMPDYDGSHFYANNLIVNRSLFAQPKRSSMMELPTHSREINAAVSFTVNEGGLGAEIALADAQDGKPLCSLFPLTDFQSMAVQTDPVERSRDEKANVRIDDNRRLVIAPQDGVAMILPSSNDRVTVRRFDLDKALAKTSSDWLVVASNPPTGFVRGQPYTYAIDVRAAHKPVQFALETAPAGMTISNDGKISWEPAGNLLSDRVPVVVSLTDSTSKVRYQSFAIDRLPDVEPSTTNATDAAKLAETAVCQGKFTLARRLAQTAGGDLPEKVEFAARPMEMLDEKQALQIGRWFQSIANKTVGELRIAASRDAGRYLNLYLALDGEPREARDGRKRLRSINSKPPGSSDLLDCFRQSMWLIEGNAVATDEGIHIVTAKYHPRLVTRLNCRGSYHLHCEFTPEKAKEVSVTFPVGTGSAVLNLGGWTGVAALRDMPALPNHRLDHKPWKIENGHPYKLDVYVILTYADAHITVDVDGKRILDWSGAQSEIKVQLPTWALPYYDGFCFCGADTLFTAATLTPLDGGINSRSIATARDFNDTFLAEMPLQTGVAAAGQNLTFTPTAAAGISSAYAIAGNFDRLEGAVHLPPTGSGSCTIACDGVVKWRSTSTQRKHRSALPARRAKRQPNRTDHHRRTRHLDRPAPSPD